MRSMKARPNRNTSASNKPSSSKSGGGGSHKSSRGDSEPRVGEEHIHDAVPVSVAASVSESDNMTRSTQSTRSLLAAMDMIEETETS